MAKIGSYKFTSINGEIPGYGTAVEIINRPGLDSGMAVKLGKRGGQGELSTINFFKSASSAKAASDQYAKLQSTFQQVEKNGINYSKILIINVESSTPVRVAITTDSAGKYLVRTRWSIMRTQEK